jgi:cytochrome c
LLLAAWLRESEKRAVRWRATVAATIVIVALAASGCAMESGDQTTADANSLTGGHADRGKTLIRKYGCSSCHVIPGVRGAAGRVGPSLDGIATRMYIAGVLSNNPENMTRWLMNPPAVDSKTAMPNMGVTTRDANDIAAYLYTLTD